ELPGACPADRPYRISSLDPFVGEHPEGLKVGNDPELPETGDVGRTDEREVGDVMTVVRQAIGRTGPGQGVQTGPDGLVAVGVHMDLETLAVELRRDFRKATGVPDEYPAIIPTLVRRQKSPGAGLQDPVQKDLRRSRRESPERPAVAKLHQLVDLWDWLFFWIRSLGGHHLHGQEARTGRLVVDLQHAASDVGILNHGDAERMKKALGLPQS